MGLVGISVHELERDRLVLAVFVILEIVSGFLVDAELVFLGANFVVDVVKLLEFQILEVEVGEGVYECQLDHGEPDEADIVSGLGADLTL